MTAVMIFCIYDLLLLYDGGDWRQVDRVWITREQADHTMYQTRQGIAVSYVVMTHVRLSQPKVVRDIIPVIHSYCSHQAECDNRPDTYRDYRETDSRQPGLIIN